MGWYCRLHQSNLSKVSTNADAERNASANEVNAMSTSGTLDSVEHFAIDHAIDFQNAAEKVVSKMANEAEHVTQDDNSILHSRRKCAVRNASKSSVVSQAQL